jgi:chromosome segregation ATPase
MPTEENPNPEGQEPKGTEESSNPNPVDDEQIKKLRRESAGYRTQLRNAETERDNALAELEKARGGTEETSTRLSDLERENARLKVALDKGVPKDLVSRLVGNTEEELAADAETLLTLLGQAPKGNNDPGVRPPGSPPDLKTQIAEAEKTGNWALARQLKTRLAYEQAQQT